MFELKLQLINSKGLKSEHFVCEMAVGIRGAGLSE